MATVKDIYYYINTLAPFDTQAEWDNSGILVGDENSEVSKILFALDATRDVLNQAIKIGADLIITHHPVIFKPVSSVTQDSLVYKLVKNNISIICVHTNYDKAFNGVNDLLCEKLGYHHFAKSEEFLNIVELDKSVQSFELIKNVKNALGGLVRFNSVDKSIKKIALCSGSGSDFLNVAKELNCDALITGDASHHSFVDANELDVLLIAAGHFETENLAIKPLLDKIENEFNVSCVLAMQETPINAI
jgi:dinuclear metal center YbgI/SA1388 family protein